MADIAASVLAKLRNKAKASGISYQQCLQLFVQEEFLRKLSKSGCEDNLILKGGLFIYTLTNFESRATIDVDFLLRAASNSINDVKALITRILNTPTGNDYISMKAKGFEEISPQRKYHGISTQIIAQIKNVRVPFNVDIGVGDVIVPRAEERKINTQLPDFEAPVIMTYSLESTIAEKFDAILQRFELTGRMKDFYDIYYLARTFDFDGAKLQTAITRTLERRGTPYDKDSFKRIIALADDVDMQKRWKYFLKNIKDDTLEFSVVIDEIQAFLEPVFENIIAEKNTIKVWDSEKKRMEIWLRISDLLYSTDYGKYYLGKCEEVIKELDLKSKVQLILTSPPFPLNNKKQYGNLNGEEYLKWFTGLAELFSSVLAPNGSIVIEMGNAWEKNRPVQSLLHLNSLLSFVNNENAGLRLCQEFVCYNPARLPSPAQWVTINRIRAIDSFTHVWWMSNSDYPKADNRRVLRPYSKSMKKLLKSGKFNSGKRPSEHVISEKGFLTDNHGSIGPMSILWTQKVESLC